MNPRWTDGYPSAVSLRQEVDAMLESFVEVLLDRIPDAEVAGIYFKGSAQKHWDSPVDYVPELSDVDIHLLFRDASDAPRRLGSVEAGLAIQYRVEEAYHAKVASPIHVPRPQLTILNNLLQDPDYIPSPKETVTTLYGDDYPSDDYKDERRLREIERQRLLSHAAFLETIPLHVIDKPGVYLLAAMRGISWRVSPIGPRALTVLGADYEEAWSFNRTRIIPLLEELGESGLATAYRTFYLSAWDYFLSNYADSAAARAAVIAGVNAMKESIALAEKCGASAQP